jgi:hypothetical protein
MSKRMMMVAALVPFVWACESTSPEGPAQVAVRFGASGSGSAAASESGWQPSFSHSPGAGTVTITGDNGTLVIEDIRFLVSEVEMERVGGDCLVEDSDDCPEFEGGPYLVRLLDSTVDEIVNSLIPAGSYEEFEFEVEDLEPDTDDSAAERQAKQAILTEVRQDYPGFPSNASMVVHGTFDGTPFTVYFDADIEVEREFQPLFQVPEHGAVSVQLDPAAWFKQNTQVMDLSAFDGQTLEFDAEFENGVTEVSWDD